MPFGMGFGELVLILIIVVVVFGATKLPQLGDGLGKAIKNFKRAVNAQNEIDVSPDADKKAELDLKTNQEGIARSPEIPQGKILVQIVAPGWKTYGEFHDIAEQRGVTLSSAAFMAARRVPPPGRKWSPRPPDVRQRIV